MTEIADAATDWRQADCVFCGQKECDVALARPNYDVRQCPDCRVMWCDPVRFHNQFNPSEESVYLEVDDTIVAENTRRLEVMQRHAPAASHPKVVEIGCMHGDFVRQLRSAGYDGLGLDLSETAVDEAATRNPGCVRLGTLDDSVADGSLDVVAAFNVIEHMDRPDLFLDDVARVLRPGGVLILETPQQEGLYHKVSFLRGRLRSQVEGIDVGVHPGTHIFKFGRVAWGKILGDRAFSLIASHPTSTPLSELLAKKARLSLVTRASIIGVGLLARATRRDNRVLVVARRT